MTSPSTLSGLYLLLDPSVAHDKNLVQVMREASAAGVRLFQYRDKQASMKQAYERAMPLRAAARELRVTFLVNDRCDLALAVDADGVHLGQDDLPVADARRLLGPTKLIGLSTHSAEQVKAAALTSADYLGFGPIYATSSKANPDPVVGLEGLRAIRALTDKPIFAIGGITPERYRDVLAAGASGAAVISDILNSCSIGDRCRDYLRN
ncbi:MAG: thiamine phosphate synthase [Nitrospiraceae bacterium]